MSVRLNVLRCRVLAGDESASGRDGMLVREPVDARVGYDAATMLTHTTRRSNQG